MSSATPHFLHPLLIKGYRPKMPILGRFVGQTFVGFRTIEQAQGVDKDLVLLRIEKKQATRLTLPGSIRYRFS